MRCFFTKLKIRDYLNKGGPLSDVDREMAAVARESASSAGSIGGPQTDPSLPVHRLARLMAQQAAREFTNNHRPIIVRKASAND